MVTESGTVIESFDGLATVLVRRGESCADCSAKCACAGDDKPHLMKVTAKNPIDALQGQNVELALEAGTVLSLSALTYLMPLVFLFIGAFTGKPLASALGINIDPELASAFFGIALLVLSFLILTLIVRKQTPGGSISPVIVKVIDNDKSIASLDEGFELDLESKFSDGN